jgi:hypothetical protein
MIKLVEDKIFYGCVKLKRVLETLGMCLKERKRNESNTCSSIVERKRNVFYE